MGAGNPDGVAAIEDSVVSVIEASILAVSLFAAAVIECYCFHLLSLDMNSSCPVLC